MVTAEEGRREAEDGAFRKQARTRRRDATAMAAIGLAAVAVMWPLIANLNGVAPSDSGLGLDMFNYYGSAGAAWTTVARFGQFPLRSPWQGGGYPVYAHPEDITLSPTILPVLAAGPWAGLKIEFVLLAVTAGIGMFLLTRRMMGYGLVAALFSATSFAFGGFLMARWLRGWLATAHAAWLPLILYALWRGRCWRTATPAVALSADNSPAKRRRQHQPASPCEGRRRWLALAAVLVAWLLVGHKYVAIVMGWFLLMVGLLGLDEEDAEKVSGTFCRNGPEGAAHKRYLTPFPRWGYFARLIAVWTFGAGLAAVKLVPMWPLLKAHLAAWRPERQHDPWPAIGLWLVIFAALGVMPFLVRLARDARTRLKGIGGMAAALAAVVLAAAVWAPRPAEPRQPPLKWIGHSLECAVHFGNWTTNDLGRREPTATDAYWARAPVGLIVALLAVVAVILRPRTTWKWALLAGLFLVIDLGPAMPRDLGESARALPMLSWVRRTREQFNFYLFFILTLLAGRALDLPAWLGRRRAARVGMWALLAANALFLGWSTHTRVAHTVAASLPAARPWSDYQLLHRRARRWRDQPCFILRGNVGLTYWAPDFVDHRRDYLVPSLLPMPDGTWTANPAFPGMVSTDHPENRAHLVEFTPNRIVVHVTVHRPGVLTVNQIGDPDWRPSEGALVQRSPLLKVRLTRVGEYDVVLRYVPVLLIIGLCISAVVALSGCVLLAALARRPSAGSGRGEPVEPRRR